jgi:hypothetical protein
MDRIDRRGRTRRWSGGALILAASVLLWAPISGSLESGEHVGTLAGLVSAALGSLLLLRP